MFSHLVDRFANRVPSFHVRIQRPSDKMHIISPSIALPPQNHPMPTIPATPIPTPTPTTGPTVAIALAAPSKAVLTTPVFPVNVPIPTSPFPGNAACVGTAANVNVTVTGTHVALLSTRVSTHWTVTLMPPTPALGAGAAAVGWAPGLGFTGTTGLTGAAGAAGACCCCWVGFWTAAELVGIAGFARTRELAGATELVGTAGFARTAEVTTTAELVGTAGATWTCLSLGGPLVFADTCR